MELYICILWQVALHQYSSKIWQQMAAKHWCYQLSLYCARQAGGSHPSCAHTARYLAELELHYMTARTRAGNEGPRSFHNHGEDFY